MSALVKIELDVDCITQGVSLEINTRLNSGEGVC